MSKKYWLLCKVQEGDACSTGETKLCMDETQEHNRKYFCTITRTQGLVISFSFICMNVLGGRQIYSWNNLVLSGFFLYLVTKNWGQAVYKSFRWLKPNRNVFVLWYEVCERAPWWGTITLWEAFGPGLNKLVRGGKTQAVISFSGSIVNKWSCVNEGLKIAWEAFVIGVNPFFMTTKWWTNLRYL